MSTFVSLFPTSCNQLVEEEIKHVAQQKKHCKNFDYWALRSMTRVLNWLFSQFGRKYTFEISRFVTQINVVSLFRFPESAIQSVVQKWSASINMWVENMCLCKYEESPSKATTHVACKTGMLPKEPHCAFSLLSFTPQGGAEIDKGTAFVNSPI